MTFVTRFDPFREFVTLQDRMNRLFRETQPEGREKEEKEENYRRVERQYGSFTRTFTVPSTVDPEKVEAHYDKGVLKVRLAKKAEAKPKQIKVNVGSEKTLEAKGVSRAA